MKPKPTIIAPCPFCGEPAFVCSISKYWYGECNSCRCSTPPCNTKREAARKWNRRKVTPIAWLGVE